MNAPLIFSICRGSIDAGPGARTTVFFKGCPLSCIWCRKPESLNPGPQVVWDRQARIRCGTCPTACPDQLLRADAPAMLAPPGCLGCGRCIISCPANARELAGREYPIDELVGMLLQDMELYRATGGGVTFSGGEPTLHTPYLSSVLKELKRQGIHLAIQSCGVFDLETFRRDLLPWLDLVYYDLKLMDPVAHRIYTGVGNETILANFAALAEELEGRLVPRVPVVPGITTTEQNLAAISRFLREVGAASSVLIPYTPRPVAKGAEKGSPPGPGTLAG